MAVRNGAATVTERYLSTACSRMAARNGAATVTERYLSTACSHGGSERSRDGYGAVLEHRMLTHGGSERSRDGYGAVLEHRMLACGSERSRDGYGGVRRFGTEPRRLRSGTAARNGAALGELAELGLHFLAVGFGEPVGFHQGVDIGGNLLRVILRRGIEGLEAIGGEGDGAAQFGAGTGAGTGGGVGGDGDIHPGTADAAFGVAIFVE